jgi:hypothetical protein
MHEAIEDRGELRFEPHGAAFVASRRFDGEELGRGTFLTVLVSGSGHDDALLEWRALRLLTRAEQEREKEGPRRTGSWSVDVRPSVLQVSSGHGELPRSRGGDRRVWWSLTDTEGDTTDLDLDGDRTGVPGLGIQISDPWHAGLGQADWKQAILDELTGVRGHTVRFGELRWVERPDREVSYGDVPVLLRNYYTLVTLYTNANYKSFDAEEAGGGSFLSKPTYFSHETSARLKTTKDPRFWASYSLREYGADANLLALLENHLNVEGSVRGLGPVQKDDGDGGSASYRAGFTVDVQPWEPELEGRKTRAGIVSLDVVAARAGYGGVVTGGSSGQSDIERALCQVIRCSSEEHSVDLDKPPSGYKVWQPAASLAMIDGNLPMIEGKPEFAQRDIDPLKRLPGRTRFVLAAGLRAGALTRNASWGNVQNLIPINAYAQYVVKLTVATLPGTQILSTDEAIMPDPDELDVKAPVVLRGGFLGWLRDHATAATTVVILVALTILVFAVPGFRSLLSGVLQAITPKKTKE